MKNYIKLLLSVIAFCTLFSCKNTLEVNAPWKETTVVYGLLNASDSVQYIKINKAFLGNGNELAYAKVADSINYGNQLSATLQEYNSGSLVSSVTLIRDETLPKDTGIFANVPNVLFRTPLPPNQYMINPSSTYLLTIKNGETGNTVTGSTAIVNTFSPDAPNANNTTFSWIPSNVSRHIKWFPSIGGIVYNLVIRIHYDEKLPSASSYSPQTLDWSFGNLVGTDTTGTGAELDQDVIGTQFYQFMATMIQPITGVNRRFDSLDFIWTVGAQDLYTYIQVYQPSIGIVQEKPTFTNLTGGIGIFSSRNTFTLHGIGLSVNSLDTLWYGPITGNLGFYP